MNVFGVVGWKNAGKTGLMERLVTEITGRGFTVSTLKHAHHRFDVDQPGKDSYRHRHAGANEVLLASRNRWALMHEHRNEEEPSLADQLARLAPVDLVLVEGYKRDDHPKVEAHRKEAGNPLIAPDDQTVKAIATNTAVGETALPVFDLDDTESIADFILTQTGLLASDIQKSSGLRNDCFALPDGVDWTPVDTALARLKGRMRPVVGVESLSLDQAHGRVLATDVAAVRANPPGRNCAVDGYGFAFDSLSAEKNHSVPLIGGRAAAGAPFGGIVPNGQAVRILTGALAPDGVDTVIMDEDVAVQAGEIQFSGHPKRGANLRDAGEDIKAAHIAVSAGQVIGAPELALLAAVGVQTVSCHRVLKVGVLSTGDELAAPGSTFDPARTYDANRPMLLALARDWGYGALDLGHIGDDRNALRHRLNSAAKEVDVIITSGGASAGDEDHVSALLSSEGDLQNWRVALKPGRPLALAMWEGVPVFGLPGNPVAAFVCSLIFARPAFNVMAGGDWIEPLAMMLPAGFSKRKKAGRREYLRARMTHGGKVEAFASEGSGRISSLSWANGLVELSDAAQEIEIGDMVRFLPFAGFGLR
ncbi:MAG: bifunctional molybdopterin-guanine dinucleotide biosynthesis adaptor protein MobB/molybdopterin molybdotransferase MoeA [Pseudoruegeria sp.]